MPLSVDSKPPVRSIHHAARAAVFVRVLVRVLAVLAVFAVFGGAAARSQDGPTLVDPVPASLYTMIADDELLLWVGDRTSGDLRVGEEAFLDSDLSTITQQDFPFDLPQSKTGPLGFNDGVRTAGGRAVSPLADQLFFATKAGFSINDQCATVSYLIDGFIDPAVPPQPVSVPGAQHDACLVGGDLNPLWSRSPYAIAAADLDRVADDSGVFHDEVILAHEEGNSSLDPNGSLAVLVLDYSAGGGQVATAEVVPEGTGADQIYGLFKDPAAGFPGTLRVDTFDGRGDGSRQIVTIHMGIWNDGKALGPVVSVFEYQGPGQLTTLGAEGFDLSTDVDGGDIGLEGLPFALATGDFTGDGKDEIAAVITRPLPTFEPTSQGNLLQKNLVILSLVDDELEVLSQDGFRDEPGLMPSCDNNGGYLLQTGCSNLELASGLFVFDPDDGFDLTRRQLAFGFTSFNVAGEGEVVVKLYEITSGGQKIAIATAGETAGETAGDTAGSPAGVSGSNLPSVIFGLTVGNFAGIGQLVDDDHPPFSQVAVLQATNLDGDDSASLSVYQVSADSGDTEISLAAEADFHATDTSFDIARLQAFDYDGDAIVLGPPVVFSSESISNVVSVLEQPPQHVDYLPNAPEALSASGLVMVSRSKDFQLMLNVENSETLSSMQTSMVSTSVGASVEASAGATVSGDALIGKGSVSIEVKGKLAFAEDNSSISSQGESSTVTFDTSEAVTSDDAVATFISLGEIWRYRIYGEQGSDDSAPNLYYEIYVPRGTPDGSPVWLSGLSLGDEYQPLHENGNILSYPDLTDGTFTPPDLGAWSLPSSCSDDTEPQQTPIASTTMIFEYGGGAPGWCAKFDQSSSCGQQRSNMKTLQASASVKTTIKAEATDFFTSAKAKASIEADVSGSKSWASLSSFTNSSMSGAQLLISVTTQEDFTTYQFLPTIYFADDGAAKVVFAAGGIPASATDFWQTNYGGPDPALNLPQKYVYTDDDEGDVVFNTDIGGRLLRGFFVRDATQIDSGTGLGPKLDPDTLVWGSQVQLEVMVYNYSVCFDAPSCDAASFSDLDVRFDVAAFDANDGTFLGRTTLGTATAQFTDEHANPEGPPISTTFSPRGVGRATLDLELDPDQLPMGDGSQQLTYALFAVLDPDDAIDETHPWRVPTVGIVPYTNGQPSTGDVISVAVLDDGGNTLGTVQVTSVGTASTDVTNLAEAFAGSSIVTTYGLAASRFPDPEIPGPGDEPFMVIVSAPGNMQLPASDAMVATLAFEQPVQGTGSLTFVPSIDSASRSSAGTPTILSSNLAIGQNNEGFGLFTVGPETPAPSASVAEAHRTPRRTEEAKKGDVR